MPKKKTSALKNAKQTGSGKIWIILVIIFALFLICGGVVAFFFYSTSGYGKCKMGESLRFTDTPNEMCVPWNQEVYPDSLEGYNLEITSQFWSGWDDEEFPSTTETYEITGPGQIIELEGMGDDVITLTIKRYSDKEVVIESDNAALENEGGGINLSNCGQQTFSVPMNDTRGFATCTMDAGVSWEIKYIFVPEE